jgi:hypothetical protein
MTAFKILVRAYYDYQRERIRLDGMIGRKKNGEAKKGVPERDESILLELISRRDDLEKFEADTLKSIAKHVHTHPLWESFLFHVKGCGEGMAAVILNEFDITKAATVSNLWSFAGLAPGMVPGKKVEVNKKTKERTFVATDTLVRADKRTAGFVCPFNQFLRAKLCGVLGPSFLRAKSMPYSMYYYNEKTRLENSDVLVKETMLGGKVKEVPWREAARDHRHKAAIRKMVKEFLKDLYVAWRTLEGLPVRKPYEEEYLGRKHHEKVAA